MLKSKIKSDDIDIILKCVNKCIKLYVVLYRCVIYLNECASLSAGPGIFETTKLAHIKLIFG
jgi:hypothetical protein